MADPPKDTHGDQGGGTVPQSTPATTAGDRPAAPLPTDVQPFPIACPCLNVTVESYASNTLVSRFGNGKEEPPFGSRVQVWLPSGAESIRHLPMSTFDKDGEEAWRKCWVCDTRLYCVQDHGKSNLAPVNVWVDVNLTNGVLYGDRINEVQKRTRAIYSGLVLDIPTSSTFGRPPTSATPVLYPAEPEKLVALLPPVPDPFFLPPPFIPNHPALREMCKAAVVSLQERHDEIERDIRAYIVQKAQDMKQLEDQVRAEVESLWDRYVQGPLGGQDVDRRGSVNIPTSRVTSNTAPPPNPSVEQVELAFDRARSRESLPSGVVPDPPSIGTQFNAHTAVAASSLLSASLAKNTFFPPPPRSRPAQDIDDVEALAKTVSRDRSVSREVAMSYAFSTLEEHAGRRTQDSVEAQQKEDIKDTEEVEEEAEERAKGIDSWAAMERSHATLALAEEAANTTQVTKQPDTNVVVVDNKRARNAHVTFQEPSKEAKGKHSSEDGDKIVTEEDVADDDDYVFDMETDDMDEGRGTAAVEQPEIKAPERDRNQVRTMVEDNLSRTFAAQAPSHRAAWRAVEERGLAKVLRRSPSHDEDEDEGDYTPSDISLARSVPIAITSPLKAHDHTLQRKTSLTDKEGVLVPDLMGAMRERGYERTAPRAIVGSLATKPGASGRRGSRSISGEREREQVKSYAADPGVVFESLGDEAVVDSDSECGDDVDGASGEANQTNGKFVPPHVLAQRASDKGKGESGWRRGSHAL